jgi:hypothetical protein
LALDIMLRIRIPVPFVRLRRQSLSIPTTIIGRCIGHGVDEAPALLHGEAMVVEEELEKRCLEKEWKELQVSLNKKVNKGRKFKRESSATRLIHSSEECAGLGLSMHRVAKKKVLPSSLHLPLAADAIVE